MLFEPTESYTHPSSTGHSKGNETADIFTDMTEETFAKLIQDMDELEIEEQWITSDVRPGRGEEKWLNLILRKE